MKFNNVRPGEDGITFDVEASHQEVAWLVDFAVDTLLKEGILSLNEQETTQEVTIDENITVRH